MRSTCVLRVIEPSRVEVAMRAGIPSEWSGVAVRPRRHM
jgi:hypothetical protein